MKKQLPRILGALVVVVAALCYAFTFVLSEGEGALVVTFGRPSATLTAPSDTGLHFVWPWPIQKVYRYDVRERLLEGTPEEVSTADGQVLVASAFVLWQVSDPRAFHEAVAGVEARGDALLGGPLRSSITSVLARVRYSSLVRVGGSVPDPVEGSVVPLRAVERQITAELAKAVESYGIAVSDVGFSQLVLPETVAGEVIAQMQNDKAAEAEQYTTSAEAEARTIRSEAQLQYDTRIAEAETEAAQIVAQARARAAERLSAVADKGLLVFLDKLNVMKELFSGKSTLVWDFNDPPFDVLEELRGSKVRDQDAGGADDGQDGTRESSK